jgi:hypothetical protein
MTLSFPMPVFRTSPFPLVLPGRSVISQPASLVGTIQAVVQKIPDSRLHPLAVPTCGAAFPPRVLLAVLTYCYATQVYAASEIRQQMLLDPACHTVCRGEFPFPREVRAFRRLNRVELEPCLATALRFIEQQKHDAGATASLNETWIAQEAKRRIIMAACLDSMELDAERFSC